MTSFKQEFIVPHKSNRQENIPAIMPIQHKATMTRNKTTMVGVKQYDAVKEKISYQYQINIKEEEALR